MTLLRLLKELGTASAEAAPVNYVEKAPLKSVKEMGKLERGSPDVVTENNSNITFVRWKDNKVVTVAYALYGPFPVKKAQMYIKEKHARVYTEQQQNTYYYNQGMGVFDCLDHSINACMIYHRSNK